jgi:hypothetical protein
MTLRFIPIVVFLVTLCRRGTHAWCVIEVIGNVATALADNNLVYDNLDLSVDMEFAFELTAHAVNINRWSSIARLANVDGNGGTYGQRLLAMWFQPNTLTIAIFVDTDDASCSFIDSACLLIASSELVVDDATDVRVTIYGSTVSLYLDGLLDASKELTGTRQPDTGVEVYFAFDEDGDVPDASVQQVTVYTDASECKDSH